jgi:hypothetical protein
MAFVVLFVVGAALMDTSPDAGASNSEILDFYGDDGNQLKLGRLHIPFPGRILVVAVLLVRRASTVQPLAAVER